jgi:hypothetical protein
MLKAFMLKTWVRIIVLPDVLAEAQAVFLRGSLVSRRIECERSMHDWDGLASHALVGIFRKAEENAPPRPVPVRRSAGQRKDCQMARARGDHTARASNEGRC